MRSLCTCAALAVVTAFAHGHFADALLRSRRDEGAETEVTDKHLAAVVKDCPEIINEFRQELGGGATDYEQIAEVNSDPETQTEEDLTPFLEGKTCEGLKSGKFAHISGEIFVITAEKSKADPARQEEGGTCAPALEQWKKGFSAFGGKHPPKYKDSTDAEVAASGVSQEEGGAKNPYDDPNAAALASLLQTGKQSLVCGTLKNCTDVEKDLLLCYFKPKGIKEEVVPVDAKLWRALEAENKLKPSLEHKQEADDYTLKPLNDARDALGLSAFTSVTEKKSRRARTSEAAEEGTLEKAVQTVLYTLTCDDILSSKISPAPSDEDFTVIYYIKDGATAPTMAEAVTYWESGFDKLKYKRPPAFTKTAQAEAEAGSGETAVDASNIYSDSAVAGYVSMMTDESRTIACVVALGCSKQAESLQRDTEQSETTTATSKSGLICVVHKATLKEGEEPISKATWAKIMDKKGYPLPDFKPLEDGKNCLEEMNAVRTQEKLGLKVFTAKAAAAKSDTKVELSSLMRNVTCPAIGGAATTKTEAFKGPEFKITDGTTSLMYYSAAEATCSAAVEAWKKGSEKFTAAPPAYTSSEEVYKDAAATNFVSLITDKATTTTATCYSTGCKTGGIVCELSAAALKEGEKPVSDETWTKYKEIGEATASGVAGVSKAALIGTVVMALAAGVFFV